MKAPIDWVISPNYFCAKWVFLNESNKVVFPWSICPIIVTIGGLLLYIYNFLSFKLNLGYVYISKIFQIFYCIF